MTSFHSLLSLSSSSLSSSSAASLSGLQTVPDSASSPLPASARDEGLPLAVVEKLMRARLPKEARIAQEARNLVQACLTDFIGVIASEACDALVSEQKTRPQKVQLTGDDLIASMTRLGLDERLIQCMQLFLNKFRSGKLAAPSAFFMSDASGPWTSSSADAENESKEKQQLPPMSLSASWILSHPASSYSQPALLSRHCFAYPASFSSSTSSSSLSPSASAATTSSDLSSFVSSSPVSLSNSQCE